ncbi:FeoC like transcriptional regulator (plasmid) [Legionella adelaidensis]|uniref:FeoC like transcriptional regulator n=1 Tax=Legionella adelaidensis TaxID=45056 RepID=A0A0W0R5X0_9GAMM|nr:FeoC-like transcriptional regulator [Legionella adelaidensis]KTC66467.1 FeoC like transcriptional regulator [Legionella adelaidensis]VEH86245.1 FeoC like transcriptional regulator [Legionella adelaidensis]
MLLKIRDFIYTQQVVSIQQLSREFNIDEVALLPMLAVWEKKGVIRACEDQDCQKSCGGCSKKPSFYRIC